MSNNNSNTELELLPCPKCNDCWALQRQPAGPPCLPEYVRCGRCGFNAPLTTWQARASVVAPEGDARPHGNAIVEMMAGTCAVGWLDCSVVQWLAGVKYFIEEEARKPNGDSHLVNTLRRAACVAWEAAQFVSSPVSPSPTEYSEGFDDAAKVARTLNQVAAQSARVAAEDECGACDEYAHKQYPLYKLCNNCWRVMPWRNDGRGARNWAYCRCRRRSRSG